MAEKIINDLHGWIVIDKPHGVGSTQVVTRLKRILHPRRIGHAGTLDPLATGVLPIALGKATKTIPFVMDGKKIYEFEVTWGAQTETDDLEGAVVASSDKRPTDSAIKAVLPEFRGVIEQVPPIYSAIKVDGARAYDLARRGEEVVLKKRRLFIEELELLDSEREKKGEEGLHPLPASPLKGEGDYMDEPTRSTVALRAMVDSALPWEGREKKGERPMGATEIPPRRAACRLDSRCAGADAPHSGRDDKEGGRKEGRQQVTSDELRVTPPPYPPSSRGREKREGKEEEYGWTPPDLPLKGEGSKRVVRSRFRVTCSKGTYVRALARDIGAKLGCFGHISALRRLKCGPFSLSHSILLDKLEKIDYNPTAFGLIPLATALGDIPVLAVEEKEARQLILGQPIKVVLSKELEDLNGPFQIKCGNQLIALAKREGGLVKPVRVFADKV